MQCILHNNRQIMSFIEIKHWFNFVIFFKITVCTGLNFCAVSTLCAFSYFSLVWVTEWPPIEKMTAHSAYNMF